MDARVVEGRKRNEVCCLVMIMEIIKDERNGWMKFEQHHEIRNQGNQEFANGIGSVRFGFCTTVNGWEEICVLVDTSSSTPTGFLIFGLVPCT